MGRYKFFIAFNIGNSFGIPDIILSGTIDVAGIIFLLLYLKETADHNSVSLDFSHASGNTFYTNQR